MTQLIGCGLSLVSSLCVSKIVLTVALRVLCGFQYCMAV